ncbi:MAG: hypothetical protein Q8M91_11035, partial [Polaromonas sp.]|nr:hypothetical protein [Polaromonas sp.]
VKKRDFDKHRMSGSNNCRIGSPVGMALDAASKAGVVTRFRRSADPPGRFILRTSAEVTWWVQAKHMQNLHEVMHCLRRGSGSADRVDGNGTCAGAERR